MTAMKRASKWMELSKDEAKPMVGQVGGMSKHKKPLLTLQPDYVLKPLITDHRGIREIAFYEALKTVSTKSKSSDKTYHAFLTGRQPTSKNKSLPQPPQPLQSTTTRTRSLAGEYFDTFAMAFAILMQDSVVLESEAALRKAWRGIKRESEILAKLAKFTAPYYGVMGQNNVDQAMPLGVTEDAHLLLQDLTINFKKPCVIDLKMGTQTYVSSSCVVTVSVLCIFPTLICRMHAVASSMPPGARCHQRKEIARIRQVSSAIALWLSHCWHALL